MKNIVIAAFLLTLSNGAAVEPKLKYPPTKVDNVEETLHGIPFVDPYRWLEDGSSSDTKAWVESQNQFTQSVLGKVPGRDKIRERLGQLLDLGSLSTPSPVKGKLFFSKREGNQNQPILYVREAGKDRVLIDPNEFAKDGTVALDWSYPSKDGKLLAYGFSQDGSEHSTLHLREVATGKDLPDTIARTRACSIAWLPDSTGFYYTRYPTPGTVEKGQETYNRHVFFHKIGDDPAKDAKVFGEGRGPQEWPNLSISPDGRWLAVVASEGWAKSEIHVRDNHAKEPKFVPLVEKVSALFSIVLRPDRWYVRTNHEAPRYRLFEVDPANMGRDRWKEILPQTDDVLDGVAPVGDLLIADYMHKATSRLKIFDRNGKLREELKFPTLCTLAGLGAEWDGDEIYFGLQSFTMAPTIYHFDLKTAKQTEWGRVKTDLDPSAYAVEQVTYKSKDGTPVTMFLTSKKGVIRDGKTPTLLYGYGGFNISLTPTFSTTRFVFLERGGVLAVANLRGGGEYGEDWHQAGMLERKQNVFDDFIAAAEWLTASGWTKREKLAIEGGSNGGLLVGAVMTQRPDLMGAVVCQVPVADMLRYHLFTVGRFWIPEYGSSEDPRLFPVLYRYSPLHNVKDGAAYPATLILTADTDDRVAPGMAKKFAARLQAAQAGGAPILIRVETRAGHGAGKPISKQIEEQADTYRFLFKALGEES